MKELFVIRLPHLEKTLQNEGFKIHYFETVERACLALHKRNKSDEQLPIAVLSLAEKSDAYLHLISFVEKMKSKVHVIPFTFEYDKEVKVKAFEKGASDYFYESFGVTQLASRIKDLNSWDKFQNVEKRYKDCKIPAWKRAFDIAIAGFTLLVLSPLFLFVALAIKLTSKGPVFYSSPRVGTGYKIFPFYKFRSMRVNADRMLGDMKHLNHYAQANKEIAFEIEKGGPMLIGDDTMISESEFEQKRKQEEKETFIKIQNDPRITKIGHFIRKTSIDELPQLVNVLLGHMSIVGNRPLPLYEAEKLTTDQWTRRFMAPAGITGLWQVTERGKASTSEDSRKQLDIEYAEKFSLWMDIKILFKTPLAAIQQEKV